MASAATIERAKKHVKTLTELHITRYTERVAAGKDKNNPRHHLVRLDECEYYLRLWESIKQKEFAWDKLDKTEQMEVIDALVDVEVND